jgi:hypothetical protein
MRFRGRGLRPANAPALAAIAALAAALLFGARAPNAVSATTCTDSQLVPNVAQLLVSQGAPGYTRFARGKETIVRAYLTTPTTCSLTNKQSIAPISATLDVSYSNGATGTAAQLTNYQPLSGRLGAASQVYSASDPLFVVPTSYLAPANGGSAFKIKFTLRITYSRNGTTTLTTAGTESNAAKEVDVDQKTNALRVLIVPMGDATSTATQWSSLAESTLQDVMTNAARAFPFPTGISPALCAGPPSTTCPLGATGGVRYVVSTAVLDARSLGLYKTSGTTPPTTKFCGTGANWGTSQVTSGAYAGHTLKADLLQRLADYNQYNNPPADLVLGVVDGAIAWKSTEGLGCDDGRATTPASGAAGQVAWVRVSTDSSYPTPLQMELLHAFGIVRSNITFHSTNVEADGAERDHGYNVLLRKVISTAAGALGTNDHSVMNYNTTSIPYTKDNTLLEPSDWKDALCDLGGVESNAVGPTPAFASCSLNSALGTSAGVAAGHNMYQISGILPLSGGVRVTNAKANVPGDINTGITCTSEVGSDLPQCSLSPSHDSPLHLLLCTGPCSASPLNVKKEVALAVLPDEGHTDVSGGTDLHAPNGFDATVVQDTAWTDSALELNGVEVFTASESDAAPDITSTIVSSVEPGTVLRSFAMPVEAGNGRAIAYDGAGHLYSSLASGSTIYKQTTSGSFDSSFDVGKTIGALAYKPDGHLIAGTYDGTGEVYDIDPSGEAEPSLLFTFDAPDDCLGVPKNIDGLAYRPTALNLAISGDACNTAFIKNLDGTAVSSFGTTNNSGIATDGAGGLWLALLTQGDTAYTELTHVSSAGTVISGDTVILNGYAAEGLSYDPDTFAPACAVWTNQATFDFSTPEIRAIAVPCGAPTSGGQSATVETTNTRFVSLFFTCGDPSDLSDNKPTFPLANGLRPDVSGAVVAAYSDKLFCNDGTGTPKIISEASNGWTSTGLSDAQATQPVTATSQSPVVNIASPLSGKYRRGEFIHYEGSATDGEQEAIVGELQWYFDGNQILPEGTGTQSFDKKIAANTPLGNHTITLKATDGQNHTSSASVTINIGPALCPSTSKCP